MKIIKAMLVSIFILGVCRPAGAESFDVKSLKYFADVDLFTVGTAENRLEDQLRADRAAGDIEHYNLETNAAIGGRIGVLHPIEDLADVGLSWGYIAGPNGSWQANAFKRQEINRRFFRLLAEVQRTFQINDRFSLLGGAGLGMAWGRQEFVTEYQAAAWENGVVVDTFDQHFHGFTWELSAGMTYKATEKLSVDLGVRYAGFPHAPNAHDVYNRQEIPGMDWNSFGIFTGVRF